MATKQGDNYSCGGRWMLAPKSSRGTILFKHMNTKTIFSFFLLALFASLTGFVVHLITVEWLPSWLASQMQGITLKPSWAVRYVAAMTSVEYGVAAIVLYYLTRNKLIQFGKFKASIYLSLLLLALNAMLIRQPLMDFLIGNPINVVVIQNIFKWLSWVFLAFIIVYGYELIEKYQNKL